MQRLGPRSTPVFRALFIKDRLLILHSMLDFRANEGHTRKLKKVQNLVQHFTSD